MKTLFTIHAGEYLVGDYIQDFYPRWNVWVPSKDTGIDLLVTDSRNRKAVSLQVKFSKDFNPTHKHILVQNKLMALGWWTHQTQKIQKSKADFWVFILPSFFEHETSFIIIPPNDLLRRFRAIHGKAGKTIQSYLSVTKTGRCWETRDLPKADQEHIAYDRFSSESRDFTRFLNAWHQVDKRLK
jgi:L-rhamnose isomerase